MKFGDLGFDEMGLNPDIDNVQSFTAIGRGSSEILWQNKDKNNIMTKTQGLAA